MALWGTHLKLSLFGESHGPMVGMTLMGLPAGVKLDMAAIESWLGRRKPGQRLTTQRQETDCPQWVSGLKEGVTTGAPLTALFVNQDTRSRDYQNLTNHPRPSHADWPAHVKWGGFEDPRGGGTFSARLTLPLTCAGAVCAQYLSAHHIRVAAHLLEVAGIEDTPFDPMGEKDEVLDAMSARTWAVKDEALLPRLERAIELTRSEGDSVGGIIEASIQGLPPGIGGEMFMGWEPQLSQMLFGIPGVKGVSVGAGFEAARMKGSQHNDTYGPSMLPTTNHAGGLVGGLTTGLPVVVKVAFKPTASIAKAQMTMNTTTQQVEPLVVKGRHDPAIVLRAVPVVEAALALVALDQLLAPRTTWTE